MKTRQEASELIRSCECQADIERVTEEIQLDALQQGRIEGAKWAADKAKTMQESPFTAGGWISHNILSSLDELKEIK